MRRPFLLLLLLLHFSSSSSSASFSSSSSSPPDTPLVFETVVYGASSAGVAAAIAASVNGTRAVALIEPLAQAGGMLSAGGLGLDDQLDARFTDFFVSGLAREWAMRTAAHYGASQPVLVPDMWVAQMAVDAMLAARASITVYPGCSLVSATRAGNRVTMLSAMCNSSTVLSFTSYSFIDASYAGDLVVAANLSYAVGRDANTTYNESLAGVNPGDPRECAFHNVSAVFKSNSSLLPYISPTPLPPAGSADAGLMAYAHRACVTDEVANRIPFPAPSGYDPRRFELLHRWIASLAAPPTLQDVMYLFPYSSLARPGKRMLCCGHSPVNGDSVTLNEGYVGRFSAAERAAADAAHKLYLLGALHFLANDPSVPPTTRASVARFGLCADEWPEHGHWPPQLYVRVGARLVNDAVLTQTTLVTPRGKPDGIAVGAWFFDYHMVTRVSIAGAATNEGHFSASTVAGNPLCDTPGADCRNALTEWYDIPYSALVPRRTEAINMLVAVALAASAVAQSSARLETLLMATGTAAGAAAALAAETAAAVQDIHVPALQRILSDNFGQAIHGPPQERNIYS